MKRYKVNCECVYHAGADTCLSLDACEDGEVVLWADYLERVKSLVGQIKMQAQELEYLRGRESAALEERDGEWVHWKDHDRIVGKMTALYARAQRGDAVISWRKAPKECPPDGEWFQFRVRPDGMSYRYWCSEIEGHWMEVPWRVVGSHWDQTLEDAPDLEIADIPMPREP